jgi:hypothetical protein
MIDKNENIIKEEVDKLWKQYNDYKEIAEQYQFVQIFIFDKTLIPAYKDLKDNWSVEHAKIFIKSLKNIIFPKLGIE